MIMILSAVLRRAVKASGYVKNIAPKKEKIKLGSVKVLEKAI